MNHILQLIKDMPVQEQPNPETSKPVKPPKIDEKAQVVIYFKAGGGERGCLIMRYRSPAQAKKVFADMQLTLKKLKAGKHDGVIEIPGSMFNAFVDLNEVTSVACVDLAVRAKFAAYI